MARDIAAFVERSKRQRTAARARAEQMRRSFAEFFKGSWHVSQGTNPLEWTPYLQGLCDEVQALLESWLVANGKANARQRERVIAAWQRHGLTFEEGRLLVQNAIFNLCPSSLKSSVIGVAAPSWMWLHDPTVEFGATSSNEDNVKRDSNAHRDLVESKWYRSTFGVKWTIKGKTDAVGRWETTAGGKRISRPWLAGFVGLHVSIMLMDDADDMKKVWNEPYRRATHEQFSRGMETRVHHDMRSLRILYQQRGHVDDMSGYLKQLTVWEPSTPQGRTGWASFVVPLRAGHGPKDFVESPFGWRDPRVLTGQEAIDYAVVNANMKLGKYPEPGSPARTDLAITEARQLAETSPSLIFVPKFGELMQPSRFGEVQLAEKILKMGSHGVSAQYDQNPEVIDGGMFPRALWRFFRVADALPGQPGFYPTSQPADPRPRPEGFPDELESPAFVLERDRLTGAPLLDWLTITVDSTFGSLDPKTASAVGLLVIGGQGLRRLVFHDATRMMTFLEVCAAIKDLLRVYPCQRVLIELKANGTSVIESLRKDVADGKVLGPNGKPLIVVVEGTEPGGDSKTARAVAMLPAVQAGLWYLLDGAHWIREFGAEVCVFPNARRDDRVDAMSQCATYYANFDDALQKAMSLARW